MAAAGGKVLLRVFATLASAVACTEAVYTRRETRWVAVRHNAGGWHPQEVQSTVCAIRVA